MVQDAIRRVTDAQRIELFCLAERALRERRDGRALAKLLALVDDARPAEEKAADAEARVANEPTAFLSQLHPLALYLIEQGGTESAMSPALLEGHLATFVAQRQSTAV